MPNLYIIAGCNVAGKTTASYAVLPGMLNCREFVNADNIAAGLSPFNTDAVAIEAGRIMLKRIDELLGLQADFAIETTLATRSYVSLISRAMTKGYKISLVFFWLNSPQMAVDRVSRRVMNGGHHIPTETVWRRYYAGIKNLFELYLPITDKWTLYNNSNQGIIPVANKNEFGLLIENTELWNKIKSQVYECRKS